MYCVGDDVVCHCIITHFHMESQSAYCSYQSGELDEALTSGQQPEYVDTPDHFPGIFAISGTSPAQIQS